MANKPTTQLRRYLRGELKPILQTDMKTEDNWLFVSDAATQHNVSHTTIINWIKKSISTPEEAILEARTLQMSPKTKPGVIIVRFL